MTRRQRTMDRIMRQSLGYESGRWYDQGLAAAGNLLTGVEQANTIFVDGANGSDTTGTKGRLDLPYLTLGGALTPGVAVSGDLILLLPGTYAEQGLTLPSGVMLRSTGGWQVTTVGLSAAVSDILTVNDESQVEGIAFYIPATVNLAAIRYSGGGTPTFSIYQCNFYGDGATGQGDGIVKSGAGKIIGAEIRGDIGGYNSLMRVDSGIIALESIHVPGSSGTINAVALSEGSGRFQLVDCNAGNANVVDVFRLGGTSQVVILGANTFNVQNSIHITSDAVEIDCLGGKLDAATYNVLVDVGLTGAGGRVRITSQMAPLFSIPSTWIGSDHAWNYYTKTSTSQRAEWSLWGADQSIGHPERGSSQYSGKGQPYADDNVVFTTNSAGAGYVDVSAAARSKDGSTFGFQSGAAGESIMWTTSRLDGAGTSLKHWAIRMSQTTAGVGGSYAFEIWSGAAWVDVGVEAIQVANQYRYSNAVFLRASSVEDIRLGIDSATTWQISTENGTAGYWARCRIVSAPGTNPVFEQLKMTPSHMSIGDNGSWSLHGLGQYRKTIFGSGNIWGIGNGAANFVEDVGTGVSSSSLTGWSHKVVKSRLNNTNDFITFQYVVPGGISTAHPVRFRVTYSHDANLTGIELAMCLIPQPVEGVLIADPAGSVVPIPRPLASTPTYDSAAAQNQTNTLSTTTHVIKSTTYEFDISNGVYSDDIMIMKIHMVNNQDVDIWALQIEGIAHSPGKVI
jgi:hypothetical protein